MSTRRPKVPRPAGQPGAAPRRPGPAAETRAPGTSSGAAASPDTRASAAARQPAQPKSAKPVKQAKQTKQPRQAKAKPADPSEARAAARQELAGEIHRDVPAADNTAAPTRNEPSLKPVPAKSFSGRLLALGIVMVVITVLLAPSVRTYLQQRSEIAALEAEIAREQETGRELEETLSRWEDPAFIKAQARERIFLVMPGETRYLVKGENGVEDVEEQAAAQAPEDLEWVDALWDSVVRSATAP
ncbi:septum formation initiator family protein [Arthrobacter koreensis]|uniref:septum formation initiator family protein n=1 Tax=Arthrobacter koreensis TaxID=199136 RepID=UPI002DBE73E2|nr:septum formation initiator family protein [Arthrobacter koreensis]MEB7504737.1 septum formation initiator family protein [Arthrobacter koreensis]